MSTLISSAPGIGSATISAKTVCDGFTAKPPRYPTDLVTLEDHQSRNPSSTETSESANHVPSEHSTTSDDSVEVQQVAPVVVLDASQRRRSSLSSATSERQRTRRLSVPLCTQSVLPLPRLGHRGHAINEPYVFSRTQMNALATAAASTSKTGVILMPDQGGTDEFGRRLSDPDSRRRWSLDTQRPTNVTTTKTTSPERHRGVASDAASPPHTSACRDPMFSFPLSPLAAAPSVDGRTPALTVTPSSPVHRPAANSGANIVVHMPTRRHSAALGQLLNPKYLEAIAEETGIAARSTAGGGTVGLDSSYDGRVPSKNESTSLAHRRRSDSTALDG